MKGLHYIIVLTYLEHLWNCGEGIILLERSMSASIKQKVRVCLGLTKHLIFLKRAHP